MTDQTGTPPWRGLPPCQRSCRWTLATSPRAAAGLARLPQSPDLRRLLRHGLFRGRMAAVPCLHHQGAGWWTLPRCRFPILAPSSLAASTRSAAGKRWGSRSSSAHPRRGPSAEGPPDPVDGGGDRRLLPVLELPVTHDLRAFPRKATMTNVSSSLDIFLTPEGI